MFLFLYPHLLHIFLGIAWEMVPERYLRLGKEFLVEMVQDSYAGHTLIVSWSQKWLHWGTITRSCSSNCCRTFKTFSGPAIQKGHLLSSLICLKRNMLMETIRSKKRFYSVISLSTSELSGALDLMFSGRLHFHAFIAVKSFTESVFWPIILHTTQVFPHFQCNLCDLKFIKWVFWLFTK